MQMESFVIFMIFFQKNNYYVSEFSTLKDMGNEWLMDRTKAWQVCKLFSHNDFMKLTLSRSFIHHFAFSQYGDDFLYGSQNYDEHFSTWTLLNFRSTFTGWLIKHHSLYSFFLSTFFLLSPQHSATLWSSLRFTKCRQFILRQNFCSAAWLWLIFALVLFFSRFL